MGNRAVIIMENSPKVGIYLHWNGGPESVLAFLEETKQRGARDPSGDTSYALARLVQTIADFLSMDGGYETSIGVGPVDQLDCDNGDNGVYIVGACWFIVRRDHTQDSIISVEHLSKAKNGEYPSQREQYDGILEVLAKLRVEPSL